MLEFDISQAGTKGFENSVEHLTALLEEIKATYTDMMSMLLVLANPDDLVIMHGGEITVDGQDFTITAGAAYYQNERYTIDAVNFTAPAGEVGVFVVEETIVNLRYPNPSFTGEQGPHRVIKKLKLQAGASGSGEKDWNQIQSWPGIFNASSQTLSINNIMGNSSSNPNFPSGLTGLFFKTSGTTVESTNGSTRNLVAINDTGGDFQAALFLLVDTNNMGRRILGFFNFDADTGSGTITLIINSFSGMSISHNGATLRATWNGGGTIYPRMEMLQIT